MRILLCDHHRLLVEALAASLRRSGHDVVAVTTLPEEAFDAAVEHDPDVCMLDVIFPGGHGIDTWPDPGDHAFEGAGVVGTMRR